MNTKIKLLIIFLIAVLQMGCTLNKLDGFKKTDKGFIKQLIGTWIIDAERQEPYAYPIYIEYFKDGTSKVHIFEDDSCQVKYDVELGLWKIYNGYLYYKGVNDKDWSDDKIIEISDSHHVLLSQGQTLYRKRGVVCN